MLALGIQHFTPPLTRPCIDYAKEEYLSITDAEADKMRTKLLAEFRA